MLLNSAVEHKEREQFYDYFNDQGIEKTVNKFITIKKKDLLIEKSKKVFYSLKLILFIKKIKNVIKKVIKKG